MSKKYIYIVSQREVARSLCTFKKLYIGLDAFFCEVGSEKYMNRLEFWEEIKEIYDSFKDTPWKNVAASDWLHGLRLIDPADYDIPDDIIQKVSSCLENSFDLEVLISALRVVESWSDVRFIPALELLLRRNDIQKDFLEDEVIPILNEIVSFKS